MPRFGADAVAEPAEQQRRGKAHELRHQQRREQCAGVEAERRAVVHRHLDDGVHAVDVEPVRHQEHDQGAVLAHVRDGVAQLAEADADGRAKARCGPRCCSRTQRITGMVNNSHHTATVTNDSCTAWAESRRPNSAGLLHHDHVDQEQQPAAEVPQRVAEGGHAVELLRLGDVEQQRVVEHHAAVEPDGGRARTAPAPRTTGPGRRSTARRWRPRLTRSRRT